MSQDIIRRFNELKRPSNIPNPKDLVPPFIRVENDWCFTIREIELKPVADLFFLVNRLNPTSKSLVIPLNPGSGFVHHLGPIQILRATTPVQQARLVLPLLLGSFVNVLGTALNSEDKGYAPYSWGTDNAELAHALMAEFRTAGVRRELCNIEVGNEQHEKILQKALDCTLASIQEETQKCNTCGESSVINGSGALGRCMGCNTVHYCSQECKNKDSDRHNLACTYLSLVPTDRENKTINASYYYHNIAPHIVEARMLAFEIHLQLIGKGRRSKQALRYPIRRLIEAGKDTPENKLLLFGNREAEKVAFNEIRIQVLLNPPPGSLLYARIKTINPCSHLKPRDALAKELKELREIKEIQELIKSELRGKRPVSSLVENLLNVKKGLMGKVKSRLLFKTAIEAMDQGIHPL